jgi:GDPmannose 4,6-dehydratase
VLATGEQHSVREFVEKTYALATEGSTITWEGHGVDEVGRDSVSGAVVVRVNPEFFRPCDVTTLLGDAGKAKKILGWQSSTTFDELVETMIDQDMSVTL